MILQTIISYVVIIITFLLAFAMIKKKFTESGKMSLLGDAFKDILPKKEQKIEESKEQKLLKMKAEIDKQLTELPKKEEPVIEISMESRFQILEHNLNVIFAEINDRLSALEQSYIQEQVKNKKN